MKKKMICAFLAGTMAVSMLTGCGGGGQAKPEGDGEKKEDTKKSGGDIVTMTCWYDEANMGPIIEALNEKLDGEYTVEYTYVALTDFNNIMSTQLAAGEGPDIICEGASFPARIKAGYVKEITGEDYLKDFNEAGFSLTSEKDKIFGIPSYGWFDGVWYNKDILDANGVGVPANFDELLAVCEKLSANGVQPLSFGLADGDTGVHSLLGVIENDFYQKDGKDFDQKFAFNEAKIEGSWDEYVKNWYQLIEKGFITDTMAGISNEQALNDFIAGKTAFLNGGPWQYTNLKDAGMNFGIIPNYGTSSENPYLMGGPAANFGINVNTKNEAGANKVMEALASLEVQQAIADANMGSSSYRDGVVVEMPEEYAGINDILAAGNIACCWDRWSINMPSEVLYNEIQSQIQGLVTGDVTVDEFLKALDSKADSIRYE